MTLYSTSDVGGKVSMWTSHCEELVTNISKLSTTWTASNIRHQHRCSHIKWVFQITSLRRGKVIFCWFRKFWHFPALGTYEPSNEFKQRANNYRQHNKNEHKMITMSIKVTNNTSVFTNYSIYSSNKRLNSWFVMRSADSSRQIIQVYIRLRCQSVRKCLLLWNKCYPGDRYCSPSILICSLSSDFPYCLFLLIS